MILVLRGCLELWDLVSGLSGEMNGVQLKERSLIPRASNFQMPPARAHLIAKERTRRDDISPVPTLGAWLHSPP